MLNPPTHGRLRICGISQFRPEVDPQLSLCTWLPSIFNPFVGVASSHAKKRFHELIAAGNRAHKDSTDPQFYDNEFLIPHSKF
jgi:hypothetical protein